MARRNLKNAAGIVTGASSGIGRHLAIQLALKKSRLIVTARRAHNLQSLCEEINSIGGSAIAVPGDITDADLRRQLVKACVDNYDAVDFVVNNAGVAAMGPYMDATPERLRHVMDVNLFAPAELCRLAFPYLCKSDRAIIVNMGSILGHRAVPLKSEYCASKFAMHGFSDSLRAELQAYKIDVLLVSPSTTDSEFFEQAIEDTTDLDWKGGNATPADVVAKKAVRAMRLGLHEIILTPGGKALVWLDRLAPRLANRLVARFKYKSKSASGR